MPRKHREYRCHWCEKPFISNKKDPIGCSPSCRGKLTQSRQGHPPWREKEIDLLIKLSGVKPLEEITAAVQRLDKRNGWEPRSFTAVKVALFKFGLSAKCTEDNLTLKAMADTLGVSQATIHNWKNRHELPVTKITSRRSAVSLTQFRQWATTHERFLKGLEFDRLFWVLGDESWAKRLSEACTNRPGERIAIRRLDTYQEFASLDLAVKSKGVYLSPSALGRQAQTGKKRFVSGGIEWEVIAS